MFDLCLDEIVCLYTTRYERNVVAQHLQFRACYRQHTFIKFEYRQANKLIGFERAFDNIRL